MPNLFFYGTLCHVPLLELVLGRSADALDLTPAELPDHAVHWVAGQAFPVIEPRAGAKASGLLLRAPDAEEIERLEFYEGGFDYDLRQEIVETADGPEQARVFFPQPGCWRADGPWSLTDWERDWAVLTLRAAEEAMGWFGKVTPAQLAQRFPPMRARAGSWLDAQARPGDPTRDLDRDVVVHDRRRVHFGFFSVEEVDLQVRQHDGSMGPVLNREALMVGQAAVVLPYDPVRDEVLVIEQFRTPLYLAGDRAPWVREAVAGLIDPGETPEATAIREAREEAGLDIAALEPVAQLWPSTGSLGEYLHLFVGLTDLSGLGTGRQGGLAEEGEDIRSDVMPLARLFEMLDAQELRDMPLTTITLWLARHRDRLRAEAR